MEASVESLKRTIPEINQTSSERFRETFAEVNRSFGEIFTRLFRGGEAEMRLQDEEDLLESGIEIVARPRRRVRPCRTDTSPEPEAARLRAGRGKAPET